MTLDNTAVAIHEFYMSLIKAGFTEAQALELAKLAISEAGKR